MTTRPHFFDLDLDELRQSLQRWGLRTYRADQLCSWVYGRGVTELDQMSDLSRADRRVLADRLCLTAGRVEAHQVASDGVQKLLLNWGGEPAPPDAAIAPAGQTECVMIPGRGAMEGRRTACVSSQIGCAVGCRFCASGLGGLDGDLTAGRIVEQVWRLGRLEPPERPGRITNVVFMGMGEPLSNLDQVVRAVRMLMSPWCLHVSGRRITISTVGLPAQIRRLARQRLPTTLAISLHAPNDRIRRRLIPWARHVSVAQLVEAAQDYFTATGREVTLEYILLRDVNDRPQHAAELAAIARAMTANVNVIRYNEVAGLPFERPATDAVLRFQSILRRAGVNVHVRASRGRDIAAACGQLRHEKKARRHEGTGARRDEGTPMKSGARTHTRAIGSGVAVDALRHASELVHRNTPAADVGAGPT